MAADPHSFSSFFHQWLDLQNRDLHDLVTAAGTTGGYNSDADLRRVIHRVLLHYERYYRVKSDFTKRNVLSLLTPSWLSLLEDAFLWIGGWRPSMAFHLLYSKSGIQLESGLDRLLSGVRTGDLGDLSPSQIARVDELQRQTIREEKELTEAMAAHQETIADSSVVELSHVVSEMIRGGSEGGDGEYSDEAVETVLKLKEVGLEEILGRADDLRLRTLKNVIEILTPIQAVHFLIAASELHLRLHDWGLKKDAASAAAGGGGGPTGNS